MPQQLASRFRSISCLGCFLARKSEHITAAAIKLRATAQIKIFIYKINFLCVRINKLIKGGNMYKITQSIFQRAVNHEARPATMVEQQYFTLTANNNGVLETTHKVRGASSVLNNSNTLLKSFETDAFIVSIKQMRWLL